MTNATRDYVTIVSGLPRSGTSMMMRMLEAGTLPVLVDEVRRPDDDNPPGYYEFEPVKQTKKDPSWLNMARGKAVKMVYRLLYDLPPGYDYHVIFMRRHMEEILTSQRKMLERNGKWDGTVSDDRIAKLYEAELRNCKAWIRRQPNVPVIDVSYNELLVDPAPHIMAISEFLGGNLDTHAMASVIQNTLYRNRAG